MALHLLEKKSEAMLKLVSKGKIGLYIENLEFTIIKFSARVST